MCILLFVYFVIAYTLSFFFIISEFSKHPSIPENVMVVTFGQDVKVIQRYSNKHKTISRCVGNIHCTFSIIINMIELSQVLLEFNKSSLICWLIDDLECEGGSPLQEGITLSTSGISSGMLFISLIKTHSKTLSCLCVCTCTWTVLFIAPYSVIGSFHVRTRIVIITDGKPTGRDEGYNLGHLHSPTEVSTYKFCFYYYYYYLKQYFLNRNFTRFYSYFIYTSFPTV